MPLIITSSSLQVALMTFPVYVKTGELLGLDVPDDSEVVKAIPEVSSITVASKSWTRT